MKFVINGYGRMGRMIEEIAKSKGMELLAAIDMDNVSDLETLEKADVLFDFSHPSSTSAVCAYAKRTGTAIISGTTGMTEETLALLQDAASAAPVLYSANYSTGVAVFRRLLQYITPSLLPDFDVEVVETHHNKKADAPSGTAKMLVDAIDPENKLKSVTGRDGFCGARTKDEIGVFALRGGTVAGEHTVSFFGEDEVLTIKHSAASRRIFAAGAVNAGQHLAQMAPGYYSLDEVLFSE